MNRTLATLIVASLAAVTLLPAAEAVRICQPFSFIGNPSGGGRICIDDQDPDDAEVRGTICFDDPDGVTRCFILVGFTNNGNGTFTACYLRNAQVVCETFSF